LQMRKDLICMTSTSVIFILYHENTDLDIWREEYLNNRLQRNMGF